MVQIFIEHRQLTSGTTLSWDLAHHLYARYRSGPVVMIAESPAVLLAALRKQWIKVVFKLKNEYASTLNPARREAVRRVVGEMENLPFFTKLSAPDTAAELGVYIIKPAEIKELTTTLYTIYVTCSLERDDQLRVINRVKPHGGVIDYQSEITSRS